MTGITAPSIPVPAHTESCGYIGRIPVRNLWLLMLYASELFRQHDHGKKDLEENPDDIPDLIAEMLAHIVEKRLKRNLTYGYRSREDVLSRVRGRIDLLTTERHQLLARGLIACRFEDLTINTPRTVLAASLAYQFGLEWGEVRSRSFRFVVIDEAFGRGSDESAQYALKLFKELNLQLLIVTPLQKIHIIEPFVSNVGFVHNENGQASKIRNLTIEEYRAEKARTLV